MVWKGSVPKNSLGNNEALFLTKIVQTVKDKYLIEVEEVKKDEFIEKTIKSLKKGFFVYLIKDKLMYVIFKDHMFKFSKGYPELETAREYGRKIGISEKEMNFEDILESS